MPRNFITPSGVRGGNGSMRMEIKPLGNWEKSIRAISKLDRAIKRASIRAQLKVGNEIVKRVKAHLRNQDLGWKPLSEDYATNKSRKGLNPNTLMATKTYYDNIQVWQKGTQNMVFIGVRRGVYTRSSNGKRKTVEVATIAVMHEFARNRRLPRRPLWNPTIQELGGPQGIKKMFLNSFSYWLRQEGVPVKSTISQLGWR